MFSSFSIGKRLGIGFAALALLILVMGGFAADRMGTAQDMVLDLTHESVPAVRELGAMATALAEYRVSERGLVSSVGDEAKMQEYSGELVAGRQAFEQMTTAFAARVQGDDERADYDEVLARSAAYFDNSALLMTALESGDLAVRTLQARLGMVGVRFAGLRFGNLNTPADLAAAGCTPG